MIDAQALHARLLTLDSHIDIPFPQPHDPFVPSASRAHVPAMQEGGLKAGCFAAYIPQGALTPDAHATAQTRAFAMLERIGAIADPARGTEIASTADAVESVTQAGRIAIIPAVENGFALGEDLGVLARFRAAGVIYMTLCHNGHNLLTDSSNPRADLGDAAEKHGGLSGLGRDAIAEMNRLGLLVDVSHVSRAGMLQAVQHSRTPVVATHSCVRALCDHPRNLDDMQLDALRDTEGLVQITAVPCFVKPRAGFEQVTVADYCDHIDYVVKRCGLAHVGISSDFDGGGGFRGWKDASESANLTAELVRRGYAEAEIAALWGGNFLRLMRRAEAEAA